MQFQINYRNAQVLDTPATLDRDGNEPANMEDPSNLDNMCPFISVRYSIANQHPELTRFDSDIWCIARGTLRMEPGMSTADQCTEFFRRVENLTNSHIVIVLVDLYGRVVNNHFQEVDENYNSLVAVRDDGKPLIYIHQTVLENGHKCQHFSGIRFLDTPVPRVQPPRAVHGDDDAALAARLQRQYEEDAKREEKDAAYARELAAQVPARAPVPTPPQAPVRAPVPTPARAPAQAQPSQAEILVQEAEALMQQARARMQLAQREFAREQARLYESPDTPYSKYDVPRHDVFDDSRYAFEMEREEEQRRRQIELDAEFARMLV